MLDLLLRWLRKMKDVFSGRGIGLGISKIDGPLLNKESERPTEESINRSGGYGEWHPSLKDSMLIDQSLSTPANRSEESIVDSADADALSLMWAKGSKYGEDVQANTAVSHLSSHKRIGWNHFWGFVVPMSLGNRSAPQIAEWQDRNSKSAEDEIDFDIVGKIPDFPVALENMIARLNAGSIAKTLVDIPTETSAMDISAGIGPSLLFVSKKRAALLSDSVAWKEYKKNSAMVSFADVELQIECVGEYKGICVVASNACFDFENKEGEIITCGLLLRARAIKFRSSKGLIEVIIHTGCEEATKNPHPVKRLPFLSNDKGEPLGELIIRASTNPQQTTDHSCHPYVASEMVVFYMCDRQANN